jgi:hypothetical protein
MSQVNNSRTQPMYSALMVKRMLLGSGIALTLIGIFLLGAEEDPAWGRFWMIRPLLVVPAAGAIGGLFYHIMDYLSQEGGWKKVGAIALSVFVYFIGLWMGTVLGLNGTLWN